VVVIHVRHGCIHLNAYSCGFADVVSVIVAYYRFVIVLSFQLLLVGFVEIKQFFSLCKAEEVRVLILLVLHCNTHTPSDKRVQGLSFLHGSDE